MRTSISANSYYQDSVNRTINSTILQGSETADVCIIGAGFTGLSAALELAQAGYKVIVLEMAGKSAQVSPPANRASRHNSERLMPSVALN
jgi:flavin-dependent dehydrogenase